jgi:WD40 repeat protein
MRATCFAVLALVVSSAAAADALPDFPLLRIDTGRHTAFIHALALDEAAGRVYSASEDKTLRIWRIADGRLLDTYRVPVGLRAEGQLYALALSPDRKTLAVGGWTCWDADGRACIYLLDAASGAPLGRITGLPEVIAALRFSPDGRALAVGLMGQAGLRVYRTVDRALLASDAHYHDKLLELDFTPNGQLVSAALDGFVRLYDQRFGLIGRVNTGLAGHQPFGLRCSPDGQYVALGFNDVAQVSLLRATDLRPVRTLSIDHPPLPRSLTRVAWAPDSSALYATGEPQPGAPAQVFRWHIGSADVADSMFATPGRIGDLAVTAQQSVLFASDEPALGLVDSSGSVRYRLASGVPRFGNELRVSNDGADVEIALDPAGSQRRRFSAARATLLPVTAPSADLAPPRTHEAHWHITDWGGAAAPRVNGRRIALEPYEEAHALAIAPDARTAVIGTEWALRALVSTGAIRWSIRMPTAVRAVNISADGRFAVAALADGTVNWYTLAGGAPVLSLFLHSDGAAWAAWTPSGYYASSVYGDMLVGWQINRGPEQPPDFFRAVQFERELYRPDLITSALHAAPASTVEVAPDHGDHLLAVSPPRVRVSVLEGGPRQPRAGVAHLRITGESTGLPMQDLSVYVNDIPVTPARERALLGAETTRFSRELDVPLEAADSALRIEVFNGHSLGVAERWLVDNAPAAPRSRQGDLYLLAVGVNDFPELEPNLRLTYAASDAREFAQAFVRHTERFRNVHVQTLSDGGAPPVRAAVLTALQVLRQAGGADTVVVFLASHGASDAAGNYFFIPRDAARADIETLRDGHSPPAESSLISWMAFFDALRNTAGRRLLIVDTCQAHDISGHVQEYSLLKRSASSRIAFILASRGDEESQEYASGRHGLFTYALLQGLEGGADVDQDGGTTVAEWFRFAAATVERLRDRRIGPQTPQFIAPDVLANMDIAPAAGGPTTR